MSDVLLFVKGEFGLAVKRAAHNALERSLEFSPNLNYSPWPRTSMQRGIFNVPGIMYGFEIDPEFWEDRNITTKIAQQIQEMPTVSHVSFLPNTHLYDCPEIEGLNLTSSDFFTRISVTSVYDAHCGYIKDLNARMKKAAKDGTSNEDAVTRLIAEQERFGKKHAEGKILPNQPPAWPKYPVLETALG